MYYLVAFVCGTIFGAIGAVIIYRRKAAAVEKALVDMTKARDYAVNELSKLRRNG